MSVEVICPFLDWVVCLVLTCMSCLYILEINLLLVVLFAIIFSHSEGCLFHLAYSSLCCAKAFKFNQVPLVYLCFYFHGVEWVIGEGSGTPLQYSYLENPMDGGAG